MLTFSQYKPIFIQAHSPLDERTTRLLESMDSVFADFTTELSEHEWEQVFAEALRPLESTPTKVAS